MHHDAVAALSVIGLVAILCQWIAWLVKLPAILFLLIAGIVLGPVGGWLHPDALFGDLLFPMVSLSVAVILFEGSLTLRFHEIAGLQSVVRNMLTIGVAVTWLVTALATRWFLGFPWGLAALFGAIMVVTGPTVIVPMLRTVRPNATVANILRWEGIMIDPIGGILAVLVFGFLLSGEVRAHAGIAGNLALFGETLIVGAGIGALAGYLFGVILRAHWLPEYLHNVAALCLVFTVYSLADTIFSESGLLAVTVMGVWLANMARVSVEDILDFKESLSVLLISGLFIILAARIDLASFEALGWGAVAVFLVMQFIARPLKVLLSTFGTTLRWEERIIIGWIGPRGIVAAAVSALFAIRLQEAGVDEAQSLVPLAFAVIVGTVVLQSATAKPLAGWLGVSEPEDKGCLIVGANIVARNLAKLLHDNGFRVRLTDSSWDNVRSARMQGLDVYYGNAVSEHADRHLDLVGLGQMLALTPHDELNTLACLRYRSEFGIKHCFYLSNRNEKQSTDNPARLTTLNRGRVLFGDDITFAKLASLIGQGGSLRQTRLTNSFDFDAFQQQHGKRAVPLFAISPRNQLHCFTAERDLQPSADWTIISLVPRQPPPMNNDGVSANASVRHA